MCGRIITNVGFYDMIKHWMIDAYIGFYYQLIVVVDKLKQSGKIYIKIKHAFHQNNEFSRMTRFSDHSTFK